MSKLSVIMSVYSESEKMLRQSIDSVLNQSFRDFEFIIVNDNPERIEIIQLLRYYMEKDNRVKVFSNEINKGLTKSLNIAAKKATVNILPEWTLMIFLILRGLIDS
ncbi:putative glycosyltransferase [Escherichia coli]|nr:putative glycosyltransferase [Escherichia coli]